jgi:hypothetical protein
MQQPLSPDAYTILPRAHRCRSLKSTWPLLCDTISRMHILNRARLLLFLAGATAAGFLISSLHASTPEEQAVMAPINEMFDGMTKRDAAAIKKPLLPGGGLVLMRDGRPTQMTFDAFAEAVGKPGKAHIEERFMTRWCALTTISPSSGRPLNFWWTAK